MICSGFPGWTRGKAPVRTYEASSFQEFEEFWDYDTHRELADRQRDYAASIATLRPERHPRAIELRIAAQIIRAMKNGAGGDLTPQEWLRWCKAFGGRCGRCNTIKSDKFPDDFLGRDFPAFVQRVMAANEAMAEYDKEKPR